MKGLWSIFVCFLMFYSVSANASENAFKDDYSDYNENIYRKYVEMDKQLKAMAERNVKNLLPYLLEAREHVNVSAICSKNLFDLITGFRKLTNWSFRFLDAMGKLQSGLQTGNIQMFGEYEECIETSVMNKGKIDFQGQYCGLLCKPYLPKVKKIPSLYGKLEGLVEATKNSSDFMKQFVSQIQTFYAYSIKIGLCVPSGCTKQDVAEIVNYSLEEYINCTVSHCLKEGDVYFWTRTRIVVVSVFVLLGVIAVVSTCCDNILESWKNNNLGLKSRILQCFSLTRNFPKLMNTDVSENSIQCFNGIRVLTIFWVILGHEYFFRALNLTTNHSVPNYENMLKSFFPQIVLNAFMSVEVFFFISGFLNSYSRLLIKQDGKPQPGALKMIAHRLWRIYPGYITVFLVMHLLTKTQPFSYQLSTELVGNCNNNIWQNVLFINNFFDPYKACMPQSWFLCVDMQLFFLTLFTIPVLFRKPKKGIILHVGIILVVNLCSMAWWFTDELSPSTLDATKLDQTESRKRYPIYNLTPVHVGPYIIGILLGYIIATKKNIKIPKITQLFGWLAASLCFISMLFMTLRWNSGIPYTQLESSLYGAWSKTIFVSGFSWLAFCCATSHGGLINYILSLKLWIPLSRITYMLFLVSPFVQTHFYSHLRFPDNGEEITIIWIYFGNLCISILMSFALVLLAESPMIAMEKILFRRNQDSNNISPEFPKELASNDIKENGLPQNGNFTTISL